MARPRATAEAKERAARIARALAGQLEEPPAVRERGGERPVRRAGTGDLVCPCCAAAMQGVGTGSGVEVDQCLECGAVWLDAGELEALVAGEVGAAEAEAPVATVAELRRRMAPVVAGEAAVRYRECPRCNEVMGRSNFGTISGVVVDECRQHGVLLDEGELQAIEAFVRMGGQALGEQARAEQGARRVPPAPEPYVRPGEVRSSVRGVATETAAASLAETIWNLLFRW